jgi:transcriptional regulator of met regulon
MSKRLQVLVDEAELREIRRLARQRHVTVSEWVRSTLREAFKRQPPNNTDRKLAAVRTAARHRFPTADFAQMAAEIESGYGTHEE